MRCPDENTFAQLQSSNLEPDEMAAIHAHFDACPSCLELATLLGCLGASQSKHEDELIESSGAAGEDGASAEGSDLEQASAQPRHHVGLFASVTLLLGHAYFTGNVTKVALSSLALDQSRHLIGEGLLPTLRQTLCSACLVWCTAGLVWGGLTVYRAVRKRPDATRAVTQYATVALFSFALAPLAIAVLFAYKKGRVIQSGAGAGGVGPI